MNVETKELLGIAYLLLASSSYNFQHTEQT